MGDVTKYTFKIEDFTPESMPFGRLVEYYTEIQKMLGLSDNLHLVNIFEGSHASAFAIDRNYETDLTKRLVEINEGTAPKSANIAQSAINRMLKEDGTSGAFFDTANQNVIHFPGKIVEDQVNVRIRDTGTFTGELYHIAGTNDDIKIKISTDAYGKVFCTTTRDIAKSLREFLFEDVKVSGRGIWTRNENGVWEVEYFSITDFAPVVKENLRQAVDRIRDKEVDWPADALGDIKKFKESGGKYH